MSHAMEGHPRRMDMVEDSEKTWYTGDGNGKPLQYSCLENTMDSMKRQRDIMWENDPSRTVGIQYATREEWINTEDGKI